MVKKIESTSNQKNYGYLAKQVNKAVVNTVNKIQELFWSQPKDIFQMGVTVGSGFGFLIGLQTGTLIGFATACLFRKIV